VASDHGISFATVQSHTTEYINMHMEQLQIVAQYASVATGI
jgi:hypothetical protein